jgi:hypothetical protein
MKSERSVLCSSADLEAILATDLSQLGQVPKLQALALSTLRTRLLKELEEVITQISCTRACYFANNDESKAKQVRCVCAVY